MNYSLQYVDMVIIMYNNYIIGSNELNSVDHKPMTLFKIASLMYHVGCDDHEMYVSTYKECINNVYCIP